MTQLPSEPQHGPLMPAHGTEGHAAPGSQNAGLGQLEKVTLVQVPLARQHAPTIVGQGVAEHATAGSQRPIPLMPDAPKQNAVESV